MTRSRQDSNPGSYDLCQCRDNPWSSRGSAVALTTARIIRRCYATEIGHDSRGLGHRPLTTRAQVKARPTPHPASAPKLDPDTPKSQAGAGPGPLAGVRIIELGQLLAGPFTGRLLGDLGAEIIKVEPPGPARPDARWGHAR